MSNRYLPNKEPISVEEMKEVLRMESMKKKSVKKRYYKSDTTVEEELLQLGWYTELDRLRRKNRYRYDI